MTRRGPGPGSESESEGNGVRARQPDADITHARQLGLVKLLAEGPAVEILGWVG
ncbi:hypothetical protein [Streptomyces cyslabdanicus]|uniref:hypothetical protein n=1 Tax=Streptomyces cyslabdanicus TaxID=1470456 RepID=UPI004044DE1E